MLKIKTKNKESLINEIVEIFNKRRYQEGTEVLYADAIESRRAVPKDVLYEAINNKFCNTEKDAIALLLSLVHFGEEGPDAEQLEMIRCSLFQMDADEFNNNSFFTDINLSNIHIDDSNMSIATSSFKPYEVYPSKATFRDSEFNTYLYFSFSDKEIQYPELLENDKCLASLNPFEINSMDSIIDFDFTEGNILSFGLGLGYFAYRCALKDDVKSVTVVEENQNIIDVFNKYIFPQFKESVRNKINIIKGNAHTLFLDKDFMNNYNKCFVKLWSGRADGIPLYNLFKENEKGLECEMKYWIEEDLITVYQDEMLKVIAPHIIPTLKKPKKPLSIFNKKIERYFKRNNVNITDKEDIYDLIFDSDIMDEIIQASVEA